MRKKLSVSEIKTTRKHEAWMIIEEMLYRGWKVSTSIHKGEWVMPIDHDLIFSCYEVAKDKGLEIEVTWHEDERLTINIVSGLDGWEWNGTGMSLK